MLPDSTTIRGLNPAAVHNSSKRSRRAGAEGREGTTHPSFRRSSTDNFVLTDHGCLSESPTIHRSVFQIRNFRSLERLAEGRFLVTLYEWMTNNKSYGHYIFELESFTWDEANRSGTVFYDSAKEMNDAYENRWRRLNEQEPRG